jgi:hypothetical protein
MTINQEFNCLGYFGFGNGVSAVRQKRTYCHACPMAKACWEKHRARCRQMFPDACAHIDELLSKPDGQKKVGKFIRKHKTEPYLAIMMGEPGGWDVRRPDGEARKDRRNNLWLNVYYFRIRRQSATNRKATEMWPFCASGMFSRSRVQVPNTLVGEVLAKGKGVHLEVESEGSRRQTLGPTNRNCIRGRYSRMRLQKKSKSNPTRMLYM